MDLHTSVEEIKKTISSIKNLQELEPFLQFLRETRKKIPLDTEFIYKNSEDVNLVLRVFYAALEIHPDETIELKRILHFALDNFEYETLRKLTIIWSIQEYCIKNQKQELVTESIDLNHVVAMINHVFAMESEKGTLKTMTTWFLPSFLRGASVQTQKVAMETVFQHVTVTKYLDALCMLHQRCLCLFENSQYWLLLKDCLIVDCSNVRKKALFLLSSGVELALQQEKYHPIIQPKLEKKAWRKVWKDYEILVDISQEKQLHLIEPSLRLLQNAAVLHSMWRMVLYKLFLRHSQHLVVYYVACFVLKHEQFDDLNTHFPDLFSAINQNEFDSQSEQCFQHLSAFVQKLDIEQFEVFLNHSLKLSWTPVAFWCFLNSSLNKSINLTISYELFAQLLTKVKYVQNLYIRRACLELLLQYCAKNVVFQKLQVLRVAKQLRDIHTDCFLHFLQKYRAKFPKIVDVVSVEDKDFIVAYGIDSEPDYVVNRLDNVTERENVSDLMILCARKYPESVVNRIVVKLSDECSVTQRSMCLVVLLNNYTSDYESVIDKVLQERNKVRNGTFQKTLLQLLLKNPRKYSNVFEEIMEESQSELTNILFDNVACLDEILCKKLLETFATCYKNSAYNMETILPQIYTVANINRHDDLLVDLFGKLILGQAHEVYVLSGCFDAFLECDLEVVSNFLPHFIELVFFGIFVQKNQRVEYRTYEQITKELPLLKTLNPNEKTAAIRLKSLDFLTKLSERNGKFADAITTLLTTRYMQYFNKRYFPDSLIHYEKLRIVQTLLLIHPHVKEQKSSLVELINDSFLSESHQQSVAILLQWLLIFLLKDDENCLDLIASKIEQADKCRPTSVAIFVAILYHLAVGKGETCWDQVVGILLPNCMGPQFKLRTVSQIALLKLYQKGVELHHELFVQKYNFLQNTLRTVIDSVDIKSDMEFHEISSLSKSMVLYEIPKRTKVCESEWLNFTSFFGFHIDADLKNIPETTRNFDETIKMETIQKKITPWKDVLNQSEPPPKSDLILVASLVEKSANLGGLSRTCEVFAVKQLVMKAAKVNEKEFQSLSMSSEGLVDVMDVKREHLTGFLMEMKSKEGYTLVGVEQTSDSRKLNEYRFEKRTLLLLGNEKEGISPEFIPLMDVCIEIPQFGQIRSLNVHVAGAVTMWEYCKQHLL